MAKRRSLVASIGLHVGFMALAVGLSLRASGRSDLPPIYDVSLVSAAEIGPQLTRPEPSVVEAVEEAIPEPEAKETVPEPSEEPEEVRPAAATGRESPRAGPSRGTRVGPDLPLTLEGRPFAYPWYLEALVRKVERNWRPGTSTLRATVYFRIDRSGRIHEARVEESSGSFLFDQAARRAVEASDPMAPLPNEYSGDYLGVYFDFDTRVRPSG